MEAVQQFKDRRTGTRQVIDAMVLERQQMWVLYCEVANLEPFCDHSRVREPLREFCQVMVDYIATSHFGLYQRIVAGQERRLAAQAVATRVYHRIARSTDLALSFNDAFDASNGELSGEALSTQLSELGEALAERIELEDEIIACVIGESMAAVS